MLVFRRVDLVLRVVVGCGRISESGVCPCEVLLGGGLVFFRAGWLIVAAICLFSGELAGFCEGWRFAVESPRAGSVPGECFWAGFCVFSRGLAACCGSMFDFRRTDLVSRVVAGCGRISESGVCPCGSAFGRGFVFFRAGWLLVAEVCLISGELTWFRVWWCGAVKSPRVGSVPVGVLSGGGSCFFRAGWLLVVEVC
jgi:hypothetical protein